MKRSGSIICLAVVFIGSICITSFAEGKKYSKIPLDKCDGCGTCAAECPEGAITASKYNGKDVFVIDPVKCNACAVCQSVCTKQIIVQDSSDISKDKKGDTKPAGGETKKEGKKNKGTEKENAKSTAAQPKKEQTGDEKAYKPTKYLVK